MVTADFFETIASTHADNGVGIKRTFKQVGELRWLSKHGAHDAVGVAARARVSAAQYVGDIHSRRINTVQIAEQMQALGTT